MTDGNNPINLFNTASGLIGGPKEEEPDMTEDPKRLGEGFSFDEE